jgi:hypothetical protein
MNQGLLSSPFPEVTEQPVSRGLGEKSKAMDQYKAIVDSRTGKVFAVASQEYKVMRHEEAIERIETAFAENPQLGAYQVSTSFYNGGGRMRRQYSFSDVSTQISPDDTINLELYMYNSYDLTWPFIVTLGAFRKVCSNGLVVREEYFRIKRKHSLRFDSLSIKKELSSAIKRFGMQSAEWRRWSSMPLTFKTYKRVMSARAFGKKATEEIEKRVFHDAKDSTSDGFPMITIWAFYNVLTWYITHCAVSLNHQVELESRLRVAIVFLVRAMPRFRRMGS